MYVRVHVLNNVSAFLHSLCIIYVFAAIGGWASVPIVAVFGPRICLVISGALYV